MGSYIEFRFPGESVDSEPLAVSYDHRHPLTLFQLKKLFPFKGQFHFRAKQSGNKSFDFVWLDLVDENDLVPKFEGKRPVVCVLHLYYSDDEEGELDGSESSDEEENSTKMPVSRKSHSLSISSSDSSSGDSEEDSDSDEGSESDDEESEDEYEARRRKNLRTFRRSSKENAMEMQAHEAEHQERHRRSSEVIRGSSAAQKVKSSSMFGKLSSFAKASTKAAKALVNEHMKLDGAALPDERSQSVLSGLFQDFNTPFKCGFEPHEKLLQSIFINYFASSKKDYEKVNSQWPKLGFQTNDPTPDIRGAGILSLKCLLYFLEHYAPKFKRFAKSQEEHKDSNYPFALAGINVCNSLAGAFFLQNQLYREKSRVYWPIMKDSSVFYELFCMQFIILHSEWDRLSVKTFSEFSNVLNQSKKHMLNVLNEGPVSLSQFSSMAMALGVPI